MSYYSAEKVIEHCNVMGPVKTALESAVRYYVDGGYHVVG
jgi:enoyl-[acyl-carrier protein] reductase I